jgi:hypothetical protein
MKITDLKIAEEMVEKHKNFSWIGWDIAYDKKIDDGYTDNQSIIVKNVWYKRKIFKLESDGWNIPDRLISGL